MPSRHDEIAHQPGDAPGSFDPRQTYIHLAADGAAIGLPGGDAFWGQPPDADLARLGSGWLVAEFEFAADWPNWEMHPGGDEIVYLLSGAVELQLEQGGGLRKVALEGRGAVLVPRGVWHTAKVLAPSRMLHVTRGAGTQQRAGADREFVHSRLIDAPPERVFRAFSDPAQLAQWWGPNGFSSSFEQFDLRPGGHWRFVMHGPDGKDYPNESVFTEVTAPQRVVIEHLSGHHFVLTVSFIEQGGGTLVGWRQVFDTAVERQRIAAFVSDANEQNLDRLAAVCRRPDRAG